jgi:hypothetical protein
MRKRRRRRQVLQPLPWKGSRRKTGVLERVATGKLHRNGRKPGQCPIESMVRRGLANNVSKKQNSGDHFIASTARDRRSGKSRRTGRDYGGVCGIRGHRGDRREVSRQRIPSSQRRPRIMRKPGSFTTLASFIPVRGVSQLKSVVELLFLNRTVVKE